MHGRNFFSYALGLILSWTLIGWGGWAQSAHALPLELDLSIAQLEAGAPELAPVSSHAGEGALPTDAARGQGGMPAGAKLDPLLRLWLQRARQGQGSPLAQALGVYGAHGSIPHPAALSELGAFQPAGRTPAGFTQGMDRVGVLISLKNSAISLRALGIEASERQGDVVTARLTAQQLEAVSRMPQVAYVEASHRLALSLDESVPSVKGDVLHEQDPISTGRGVFLGSVDTGIDWTHLDFRLDRDGNGSEEGSRIAFLWDQNEQDPVGHRTGVPYGTEYTRQDIEYDLAIGAGFDAGRVRERDENGHGTHVMGIQGGDGSASDGGYVGMAPEATLGMVSTTFSSGDIVDGVAYLFDRGSELGLPTVVNLSLGGHFGPHDGTSAFERGLESMVGPGRIIVNSAGNEGNDAVHVSGDLHNDAYTVTFTAAAGVAVLNFWYEGSAQFALELDTPGPGAASQRLSAGRGEVVETQLGDSVITIDNASQGPYPFNGDNNLLVVLENIAVDSEWMLTLHRVSGSGRFDGWVGLGSMGAFSDSDPDDTISEPGNAPHLITVGAYTSKARWPSIVGRSYGFASAGLVGDLAGFSSRGPTRDGRQKPDLTAPGTAVVSALAAESELSTVLPLVSPDGVHVALQGTSMAAPHVSGVIALMLQADPSLDGKRALARLRGTASGDEFTGVLPNERWGFGKLNSLEGVDTLGLPLPLEGAGVSLKVGLNEASERAYFFYTVPQGAQTAQLQIYDVLGRQVSALELDPARHRHPWNLRDERGARLAGGLYLCIVKADGKSSTVQLLVIGHE